VPAVSPGADGTRRICVHPGRLHTRPERGLPSGHQWHRARNGSMVQVFSPAAVMTYALGLRDREPVLPHVDSRRQFSPDLGGLAPDSVPPLQRAGDPLASASPRFDVPLRAYALRKSPRSADITPFLSPLLSRTRPPRAVM
jgi:hypothetical protein